MVIPISIDFARCVYEFSHSEEMASGSRLLTAAEVARQIQENSDPLIAAMPMLVYDFTYEAMILLDPLPDVGRHIYM